MTDKKPTPPPKMEIITKGYKPVPTGSIQGGYQGPSGSPAKAPTTGSSIQPRPVTPTKK